jgi:hypothetical protein
MWIPANIVMLNIVMFTKMLSTVVCSFETMNEPIIVSYLVTTIYHMERNYESVFSSITVRKKQRLTLSVHVIG